MIYLALLVFAICLTRAQFMVAIRNIGAHWNGYGAINGVWNRSSDAPMVYRVLVPWLTGRTPPIWRYELCHLVLMYLTLISINTAWGLLTACIAMILITSTFLYDYWDWMPEVIGFSLALMSLPLATFGVVLSGLSRETAPLVGVVYALHSGDYMGGALLVLGALAIQIALRIIQGEHPLYCTMDVAGKLGNDQGRECGSLDLG